MLGSWQLHDEYLAILHKYDAYVLSDPISAAEWAATKPLRRKLANLNVDSLHDFFSGFFSSTGRPANLQPQIFRSFILMSLKGYTSLTNWVDLLEESPRLAFLIGCDPAGYLGNPIPIPSLGSHYNFISRLWSDNSFERLHSGRSLKALLPSTFYKKLKETSDKINEKKKAGKLKKNVKLEESNPKITDRLTAWASSGRDFPLYFEKNVQQLFFLSAVQPSIDRGLIPTDGLTVSGDGSSWHIHSNPNGHRPTSDEYQALPYDDCPRFFQDPEANFGWDSDLGTGYYGYTLYMLCSHNVDAGIDLPLHIRVTSAARNDAITGIIALHEFFQLHPEIQVRNVCLDSAHDNKPTYTWLESLGSRPFIDLNSNRGRKKSVEGETTSVDEDGNIIPKCKADIEMVRNGNDYTRMRTKYRCPLKSGLIESCPYETECCKTDYGRTVYVNWTDNPRLNTPVPRDSDEYKEVYKNRTSCERCNKRVLIDYGLEQWYGHTRMRASFMAMLAGICIHLDAQVKVADAAA